MKMNENEKVTFYDRAGGHATFEELVSHFYGLVAINPILSPMYPDRDFKDAARKLLMFLEQYWGGPTTYQDERGHPRLRARHGNFHIAQLQKDEWLTCMKSAVDELTIESELKEELWNYLEMAANSLVNQPD